MATPFLKWAGGKTQLLKTIDAFLPAEIDGYFEPFIGGGAVFFHLCGHKRIGHATISDSNQDLINCYRMVRDRLEELIEVLSQHRNDQEYFYQVRALPAAGLDPIERAARLIFLNKTCFNGLYRVNRSGQFNVPFGRYKNPRIVDEENLRAVSAVLKGTTIDCRNFEEQLPLLKAGHFIYLDPPYQPISSTSSFTGYTSASFDMSDQRRLARFFRAADKKGCFLMLSNSDNEQVSALYRHFRIERVLANRAINSNGQRRGKISELLITNY